MKKNSCGYIINFSSFIFHFLCEKKIPTRINKNDNDIHSPKLLAKTFNDYFIDKTEKTKRKF